MQPKFKSFSFPYGLTSTITGSIEYHLENYGEDVDGRRGIMMPIIDEIHFDPINGQNLDEFMSSAQYAYILEKAKEVCHLE